MKAKVWDKIRAQLKKEFDRRDIRYCELCGRSDYLSFAHRLKRRFITTEEELRVVALLCMDNADGKGCHNILEFGDKQVMFDTITEIHERRGEGFYADEFNEGVAGVGGPFCSSKVS